MANVETLGLGPQKSLFVLVIIVGCFAVLWPRILSPMFVGPVKDSIRPNNYDREAGCCDVISESDVNAVRIMAEVCGNILRNNREQLDSKMEQALSSGKLTKEIISTCRQEVNRTCGVDIALFLDHNIRLGKTYKQILDDVRSYNSSNCLKMNYGVAPWALGVPHLVGKFFSKSVRQERPPHLQHPPLHPALRERGRAIVPAAAPSRSPLPGRVWPSPLHVYLSNYSNQPMPVRPPMGGAGGVVPPPKSSVGFLMPLYTLCIVVFFFYTIFKMVFSKSNNVVTSPVRQQSYIDRPESKFHQSVFKGASKRDHQTSDTRLVVNAISGLVAEVRQQMEDPRPPPSHPQDAPPYPYTNGSVHSNQREASPLVTKDFSRFKETTPPSWEDSTPVDREATLLAKEFTAKEKPTKEAYEKDADLKEAGLMGPKETSLERDLIDSEPLEEDEPAEKIGEVVEEMLISEVQAERPAAEDEAIRQLRSSVEKEKASFKVLGMEMRAHCEGGRPWGAPLGPPPPAPRQPTPPVEVSSIYLEGALPHQSRLLVSDSETQLTNGGDKDTPIVLSGKMTLSLINDESAKTSPDRDNAIQDDLTLDDDEDFQTASAATSPKQDIGEYEDGSGSDEEIGEEMEVISRLDNEPSFRNRRDLNSEDNVEDIAAKLIDDVFSNVAAMNLEELRVATSEGNVLIEEKDNESPIDDIKNENFDVSPNLEDVTAKVGQELQDIIENIKSRIINDIAASNVYSNVQPIKNIEKSKFTVDLIKNTYDDDVDKVEDSGMPATNDDEVVNIENVVTLLEDDVKVNVAVLADNILAGIEDNISPNADHKVDTTNELKSENMRNFDLESTASLIEHSDTRNDDEVNVESVATALEDYVKVNAGILTDNILVEGNINADDQIVTNNEELESGITEDFGSTATLTEHSETPQIKNADDGNMVSIVTACEDDVKVNVGVLDHNIIPGLEENISPNLGMIQSDSNLDEIEAMVLENIVSSIVEDDLELYDAPKSTDSIAIESDPPLLTLDGQKMKRIDSTEQKVEDNKISPSAENVVPQTAQPEVIGDYDYEEDEEEEEEEEEIVEEEEILEEEEEIIEEEEEEEIEVEDEEIPETGAEKA